MELAAMLRPCPMNGHRRVAAGCACAPCGVLGMSAQVPTARAGAGSPGHIAGSDLLRPGGLDVDLWLP